MQNLEPIIDQGTEGRKIGISLRSQRDRDEPFSGPSSEPSHKPLDMNRKVETWHDGRPLNPSMVIDQSTSLTVPIDEEVGFSPQNFPRQL